MMILFNVTLIISLPKLFVSSLSMYLPSLLYFHYAYTCISKRSNQTGVLFYFLILVVIRCQICMRYICITLRFEGNLFLYINLIFLIVGICQKFRMKQKQIIPHRYIFRTCKDRILFIDVLNKLEKIYIQTCLSDHLGSAITLYDLNIHSKYISFELNIYLVTTCLM